MHETTIGHSLKRYHYSAFGLSIASEINLPELLESEPGSAEVLIRFGFVPGSLENPKSRGVRYQASPGSFLMVLERIASFLVTGGNEITIAPGEHAKEEDIRLFLLGSAFGALLHQRKNLVIHGSAIQWDNQALLFSGLSGAGKSTLVASLMREGYPLITDDVCAIRFDNEENPLVQPGYPQVKLWTDAILRLGDQPENHRKLREQIEKYGLQAGAFFVNKEVRAGKVFILSTKNAGEHSLEEIKGVEKFTALRNNTYRFQFIDGLGITSEHFRLSGLLAGHCRIFRLVRSLSPDHRDTFASFVLNKLRRELPE